MSISSSINPFVGGLEMKKLVSLTKEGTAVMEPSYFNF
jgi:hypothetical protein